MTNAFSMKKLVDRLSPVCNKYDIFSSRIKLKENGDF